MILDVKGKSCYCKSCQNLNGVCGLKVSTLCPVPARQSHGVRVSPKQGLTSLEGQHQDSH